MDFIGRTSELATLNTELNRGSGFVVIYGRRRVGKNNADQRIHQGQACILLSGNNGERSAEHEAICRSSFPDNKKSHAQ